MQFRVRPYRADDAAAIVAMSDAIYPAYRLDADAWHPAEQYDNVDVSPFKHVAVDTLTGEIAGYGAIRTTRLPYARLDLMVHPQWQRRGAGSLLLAQLCADLEALTAETAQVRVRADKPDVLAWLHKRGFAERHRMYGLRLAVPEANLEPFQPLLSRIRDQGIAITTFADERIHDPACVHKLHALQHAVLPDWPDPDPAPFQPMAFEDFVRRLAEADALPDALFIAKADDYYVGYCGMFALGTAVRPAYRGQGLATALKVRSIEYAQRHDYRTAITCTANPAMLAVNEKLGYRHELTEVRLIAIVPGRGG